MARRSQPLYTPLLPFGALRNSDLFSNHWLEHRLPLQPEWEELRAQATEALGRIESLWRVQRSRVERYGDEQGLEQAFIQPVLQGLGWKLKYQTYLQGRKPDYALFLSDESLDAALRTDRTSSTFWNHPVILADAKAWHVNLDRPTRVGQQREYPPEQIEWYLDRSRLNYAILTNGRLWRLIPRQLGPGKPRFQTYLETDLPRLLDARIGKRNQQLTIEQQQTTFEEFLRFYLFFSPHGFSSVDERKPFVERALTGSSEYALSVGEDLKERVFEALRLCIEGFLTHVPNELSPETDLELCREQSLVLLYRLLFIMYAEDRGLLPYRRNRLYTDNRSLARHRDEIAEVIDRISQGRDTDYPPEQTGFWDDLGNLFDLIDRGHARYGVPAYNGGLFDPGRHPFLAEARLPDRYLVRVIDQLGRAEDPSHRERGLFRVDYRDLAIQHLGSVYEGLLELQPHSAMQPMVVIRHRHEARKPDLIIDANDPIPSGYELTETHYEPGQVYLQTDKGERRSFGSYYTPDHIVDYIVENTLGRICGEIHTNLGREIDLVEAEYRKARNGRRLALAEKLETLRQDFGDRILRLRVLDPAMGSGHFLVRACQRLAEEIATNPHTADPDVDQGHGDEPTLIYWKRRVVETCIYGVDVNPMAVELAKLALWLETVSSNAPLSFLDHHLQPGNSLVGARVPQLAELPGAMELQHNVFKEQVEQRLPILLEPLTLIRSMPSESPEQVKEKERLYRRQFEPACRMFRGAADLWCSSFFAPEPGRVTPEQYQSALSALRTDAAFKRLATEPWFVEAVKHVRARQVQVFHWELVFPEVFFDKTGRRSEAGFDVVIGNPPYDVLSEKETGRNLAAFKSFIEYDPLYTPSRRGKNNLYKLFICRALELLADGGAFGFIVPMAFLGDYQAADLRDAALDAGAFTSIDAFPQKDDPKKRVFPDAKLSTAVFTMVKSASPEIRARAFKSRQHPANKVEETSASLQLHTDEIPLYDPTNRSIVTCSQSDWDVAVRIMARGRMTRLGTVCEFFQGEVNENNQRRAGNLVATGGKLVTRGASICLYAVREASQGDDMWLDVAGFLRGASPGSKAYHHLHRRVVLQEASPQNNFRRIIAAQLPAGEFCNHTINYCPAHKTKIHFELMLAILNSKPLSCIKNAGSASINPVKPGVWGPSDTGLRNSLPVRSTNRRLADGSRESVVT